MRFMAIVKATKDSEAGKMLSEELLSAMAKFNEEMVKAGTAMQVPCRNDRVDQALPQPP